MMTIAQQPKGLKLRHYQEEAVREVLNAPSQGINRPMVVLPTGTGKTHVAIEVVQKREGRAVILAHCGELLQQMVDKIRLVSPLVDLGIVKAGQDEVDAHIIIGSVQTLSRFERLTRLVRAISTIVMDEAHHCRDGNTYHRILEHLGAFDPGGPLTLGVTATPYRFDKAPLGAVFQEIVYQKSILEMIRAGYLSDLRAFRSCCKLISTACVHGGVTSSAPIWTICGWPPMRPSMYWPPSSSMPLTARRFCLRLASLQHTR